MKSGWTLFIGVLLGCGTATPPKDSQAQEQQTAPPPISLPARASVGRTLDASRQTAISRAAAEVAPAVVSVHVTRRDESRAQFGGFWRSQPQIVQGFGSGFIVTADGLVITNQHVTADAIDIVVTTRDGVDHPAVLLGEDPLTDIAILDIEGNDLPVVQLGVSTDLQIGEWVVAFGNPYAYLLGDAEPTVTAGVVSAVGRNLIPSGDDAGIYVGMIQTDAAINPGNSGGPLTNALGQVVGVNSSIFSNSGGSIGIGFAIPIERAVRVANELRTHGSVRRAWTGLVVSDSDDPRGWKQQGGLRITQIAPDSPADRAGLRAGDVLVAADGHPMRTFLDWEAARLDIGVGDTLALEYLRRREVQRSTITVEDLPSTKAERISVLTDIQLATLTAALKTQFDLESPRGALIIEIGDRTSRITGLQAGDLILAINRNAVREAEDVSRILNAIAGRRRSFVQVYYERNHRGRLAEFRITQ